MDFLCRSISLCLLLFGLLAQVVQSRKPTVCRTIDDAKSSITCRVEVNTTIRLVCPTHVQGSGTWWDKDGQIHKDGNNVFESETMLDCNSRSELCSLLVPNVSPGFDSLYYCGTTETNRFEFILKAYIIPSVVIRVHDEEIDKSHIMQYNQQLPLQCYIKEGIPPLNMTWLINEKQNYTTSFLAETNKLGDFSNTITVTISKRFTNITCTSNGPYISSTSKTIVIEGLFVDINNKDSDGKQSNGNNRIELYIAVPCLFVTSVITTFFLYFKVKNERKGRMNKRTDERHNVSTDGSGDVDMNNAFVYSDITQESETTAPRVILSPMMNTSLVTRLKTGSKFDYWSATCIRESLEEEKCFAKTLSNHATVKDAKIFQELALALEPLKNSAFLVQLICVSVEEIPYAIYYEYMEYGSLRDFMLRRYQQNRNSRLPIRDANTLPANTRSQIEELLTFATMITSGMKFITSHNFSHPVLSLRKVLLSEHCQCKLYDIYPTEMAMMRVNDLTKKDYPPIAWLAPETIFLQEYETSSDVWSFAVLLWELFSLGDTPFARNTADEVERKIRQGVLLTQPLSCPGAMYGIMLSCWNNTSNKRPTFDAILSKMDRMLEKFKQNEDRAQQQNEAPQPSYFTLDGDESTNNYI